MFCVLLTKVVQKRVDCNLSKPIMIGQFTMVFSLMDPKERMKSSHCTLVGSPILLVGVARRSYVLNIWSIIFKSASRSWLLIELKKEENGRKTINFSPPLSRGFPEILIVFELWSQVRTQWFWVCTFYCVPKTRCVSTEFEYTSGRLEWKWPRTTT